MITDFFALLDQPRLPWPDQAEVKQAFHEKSKTAHPDARPAETDAAEADAAFAKLSEGYQVLQDPKRRLGHLLALEGETQPAAGAEIADDIAILFQTVAGATQEAERVLEKFSAASNPLSRSLLQSEVKAARNRMAATLKTLHELQTKAESETKALNNPAARLPEERVRELQRLYTRFAYLTRWIGELSEKQTRLSCC